MSSLSSSCQAFAISVRYDLFSWFFLITKLYMEYLPASLSNKVHVAGQRRLREAHRAGGVSTACSSPQAPPPPADSREQASDIYDEIPDHQKQQSKLSGGTVCLWRVASVYWPETCLPKRLDFSRSSLCMNIRENRIQIREKLVWVKS